MDNRFGFKDLLILVLLAAILGSIWLAMTQYDRQWEVMRRIDQNLAQQNETLRELKTAIGRGVRVADGGGAGRARGPATVTHAGKPRGPSPTTPRATGSSTPFAQSVGKLTPIIPTDAYQSQVASYVLESLLTRDPDTLEWAPGLAEAWQVSDDGLTISFDLRQDLTFSDGAPLTSADVLFTLDLIRNPEINAPQLAPYYEPLDGVVAEGPHRVVFTLNTPYFLSLEITAGMDILPKHFYEKFTPDEFNASTGLLMGSGPYRLAVNPEDWRPGAGQIELVRNDNYWGLRPTFDRLRWQEITEEAAIEVSMRNGDIDRLGVRSDQYLRLKDDAGLNAKADLYEYNSVAAGYRYIGWNQRKDGKPTPFADVRVRRAMTMLLNREEMCAQLMAGLATVATGPFNPLSPQYDPGVEPIAYDPEGAKALLAEAGFRDGDGDGVLEDPNGEPFRFSLIYPSGINSYQQMAQYLRDAYARAGVVMDLDPTEFNTMLGRIDERNFEAITLGWSSGVESDPKQIFHSDSIAGGGNNYVSYRNEELDTAIDEARLTVDFDERTALWHRVHRILQTDQPYTFLFNSKSVVFLDKRFRNVMLTKVGLNDRTEYFVPKGEQRWTTE